MNIVRAMRSFRNHTRKKILENYKFFTPQQAVGNSLVKEGKLVDAFVYEGEEKKYTRPPIIFGSTSEYKLLPAPFQEQLKPIYDGTRLTMEQIIALQQRDFTAKILVSLLEEIERLRSEGTITPAEAERRWKEHCKKITE